MLFCFKALRIEDEKIVLILIQVKAMADHPTAKTKLLGFKKNYLHCDAKFSCAFSVRYMGGLGG